MDDKTDFYSDLIQKWFLHYYQMLKTLRIMNTMYEMSLGSQINIRFWDKRDVLPVVQ